MPSSLNLFIRIPKGFSEQDVFDSVNRKDICKIIDVVIKKGKTNNNAIIMIDYWYKGTRHIRDTLIRGDPVSIPNPGHNTWLAFEFKPKIKAECAKVHPAPDQSPGDVDEFGRDNIRKNKPTLSANARVFIPTPKIAPELTDSLLPFVTDNRAERERNQRHNEDAANAFIQQYECYTSYATPVKMYGEGAIAPGAPMKANQSSDMEEGEMFEVAQKLDDMFIEETVSEITDCDYDEKPRYIPIDFDSPKNPVLNLDYSHTTAVRKRRIKFIRPTK